jgi:hypothetical protein
LTGEVKNSVVCSLKSEAPLKFRITLPQLLIDELDEEEQKQGKAFLTEENST